MFLIIALLFNLLLVRIGFRLTKNKFKKSSVRIIVWTAIFIGLFIIEIGFGYYFLMQGFKVSPKFIFKEYLADPIPKNVKIIEGEGFSWLGWRLSLIFTADADTIEKILSQYPSSPDCAKFDKYTNTYKNLKEEVKSAFKKQDITLISNLTCYYKYKKLDEHDNILGEEVYIFWDKERNRVFFYCSGGS